MAKKKAVARTAAQKSGKPGGQAPAASRSAADTAPALHGKRFPNESPAYRTARNKLLDAEIKLRRANRDCRGDAPESAARRRSASRIICSRRARRICRAIRCRAGCGCRNCSGIATRSSSTASCSVPTWRSPARAVPRSWTRSKAPRQHINQRTNLVIVARSPAGRIQQLAHARGWRRLRFLSSGQNSYNRDYHAETANGAQMPMINVFVRRDGKIHHFAGSELLYAPPIPARTPATRT